MPEQKRQELVLSYHRVRQALGFLGLLFPILLLVSGLMERAEILPSLSDYYHSTARDIFVGCLFAIGIFLISYKGYAKSPEELFSDDRVATIAGLAAFGVALFPNKAPTTQVETLSQMALGLQAAAVCHYVSAIIFLACLSYFCLVKFSRTANPARRQIYRTCGWFILLGGLAATIASAIKVAGPESARAMVINSSVIFWVESLGIWAFGISWLTKGKADRLLSQRRVKTI